LDDEVASLIVNESNGSGPHLSREGNYAVFPGPGGRAFLHLAEAAFAGFGQKKAGAVPFNNRGMLRIVYVLPFSGEPSPPDHIAVNHAGAGRQNHRDQDQSFHFSSLMIFISRLSRRFAFANARKGLCAFPIPQMFLHTSQVLG
jgi:hypothetical protein